MKLVILLDQTVFIVDTKRRLCYTNTPHTHLRDTWEDSHKHATDDVLDRSYLNEQYFLLSDEIPSPNDNRSLKALKDLTEHSH